MNPGARSYLLTPLAEADLEDIWLYTRKRWSSAQADRYLLGLFDAFEALDRGDVRGRPTNIRPGYLKYPCAGHVIYFRVRDGRLEIVRILHGGQDVERHLPV